MSRIINFYLLFFFLWGLWYNLSSPAMQETRSVQLQGGQQTEYNLNYSQRKQHKMHLNGKNEPCFGHVAGGEMGRYEGGKLHRFLHAHKVYDYTTVEEHKIIAF